MEILMQIFLEAVYSAYYSLAEKFSAGKGLKKWQEYTLKILCAAVSFTAFMLVLFGCFWLADEPPFTAYGAVMLAVGASVLAVHAVAGGYVIVTRMAEEKRAEERADEAFTEEHEPMPAVRPDETEEDDGADP